MRIPLLFLISVSLVPLSGTLLLVGNAAADAATSPNQGTVDQESLIDRLIVQLGSDRYVERRRAQLELGQFGPRAFDALYQASSHADPEVATAAGYLLAAIPIHWSGPDDSKQVRNLLSHYGHSDAAHRLSAIKEIAYLPRAEGLASLCRIVRFDASEALSRSAAVAILSPRKQSGSDQKIDSEVLTKLLGGSQRHGADWLRLYARQLSDPASTLDEWEKFIDAEVVLARQVASLGATSDGNTTSDAIVVKLLWHLLDLYQQLDQTEPALKTVARLLDYDPTQFETMIVEIIDWFAETKAWGKLDELLSVYSEQISKTRRPQYVAAIARQRQGQEDLANQLANAALASPTSDTRQLVLDAQFLVKRERWEWAKREYQHIIDREPLDTTLGLIARNWFATLLNDMEENDAAAAVLEPIESKIKQDTKFRHLYNTFRKQIELLSPKELSGRRQYYLACDCRQQEDWEGERKHLRESIDLDPENADVVIAMYRAQGTDNAWQEDVQKRIAKLTASFQQEIEANPNESQWYNQWAWLISNTEGDYQKAVRYSHRSLEMIPAGRNSAGYLDTLGRCYYAVGDLENAVKYQRQAVEQDGSLQVLRRQLAEFETAIGE